MFSVLFACLGVTSLLDAARFLNKSKYTGFHFFFVQMSNKLLKYYMYICSVYDIWQTLN